MAIPTIGPGQAARDFVVSVDWTEIRFLGVALRKVPTEFQRESRAAIKAAGADLLREATWRASQFSTRIPRALSIDVRMGQRAAVGLRARLSVAPHARMMEGFVNPRWRHPVYGNDAVWVQQDTHPYLEPAAQAAGAAFVEGIKTVLADVYRRVGLI